MQFLRNVWYAAALPEEIGRDHLLSRPVIDQPVVFYRREDGEPVALADRCPHRFAPLSRGRLVGDVVQCGYHGLEFDTDGSCAGNPYGPCLDTMRVDSIPVVERHGLIWIWLGDRDVADPSRIPDLSPLFANGRRTRFQYHGADYRTDILVDNLLDLSHVAYLHPAYASASARETREPSQIAVSECESGVVVENVDRQRMPLPGTDENPAYAVTTTKWYPGNVLPFVVEIGTPGTDVHFRTTFTHICTPATASSTHYIFSETREASDDEALDEASAIEQRRVVVEEDSPMLAAIDALMYGQPLLDLKPVMLPTDKTAIRVRRVLEQLMEDERTSVTDGAVAG